MAAASDNVDLGCRGNMPVWSLAAGKWQAVLLLVESSEAGDNADPNCRGNSLALVLSVELA